MSKTLDFVLLTASGILMKIVEYPSMFYKSIGLTFFYIFSGVFYMPLAVRGQRPFHRELGKPFIGRKRNALGVGFLLVTR